MNIDTLRSRQEIIQTALYAISNCLDTILSSSYISVAFLLMYGSMWMLNMRLDTGFFALAYVLLSYTRQSSVKSLSYAVQDMVAYLASQRRIRVS